VPEDVFARVLFDTCSGVDVILSSKSAEQLGCKLRAARNPLHVTSVHGDVVVCDMVADSVHFDFTSYSVIITDVPVMPMPENYEAIFGLSWLRRHKAVIDLNLAQI